MTEVTTPRPELVAIDKIQSAIDLLKEVPCQPHDDVWSAINKAEKSVDRLNSALKKFENDAVREAEKVAAEAPAEAPEEEEGEEETEDEE